MKNTTKYDSVPDTLKHIRRVQELILEIVDQLLKRAFDHDASKLQEPEKSGFDYATPRLKNSTYNSDEYKGFLKNLAPVLDHHYKNNSHHPQYYDNGVSGMDLIDIVEMLCDWKAAGERHANGSIEKSLEINKDRFSISDQLQKILENTASNMSWSDNVKANENND